MNPESTTAGSLFMSSLWWRTGDPTISLVGTSFCWPFKVVRLRAAECNAAE